jgi:hypothetical protein
MDYSFDYADVSREDLQNELEGLPFFEKLITIKKKISEMHEDDLYGSGYIFEEIQGGDKQVEIRFANQYDASTIKIYKENNEVAVSVASSDGDEEVFLVSNFKDHLVSFYTVPGSKNYVAIVEGNELYIDVNYMDVLVTNQNKETTIYKL